MRGRAGAGPELLVRHLLAGDPLHEMQAAFLFFALAGMPIPSMKVTALRDLGPGTEAKPTLSTTFDLVLSSNGAQQPMRSHHIAPRPCMKVVRHAFHLKPMFLGGPHSFVILWWCFPASIAAGVWVSRILPFGVTVSWFQPSRMLSWSTTLAFFRPCRPKP